MYWSKLLKLAALIAALAGTVTAVAITPTRYMDTYSRTTSPVIVNDSLILELTNSLPEETPEDFLHCAVNVVTDPARKLIVHFISIDISYESSTPDRVHVYDYTDGRALRLTPASGLYGIYDGYYRRTSRGVRDYLSSENKLRIDYIGKPTRAYKGFQILISSFKDTDSYDRCPSGSIKCEKTDVCLPYTLHCDGFPNCGEHDDSDEVDCTVAMTTGWDSSYGTNTAIIVSLAACSVFLSIAVVIAVIVIKYNKRQTRPNIQVTFKRGQDPANDSERVHLYAPPSYNDVFGYTENAPPPAYDTITTRQMRENAGHNVVYVTRLQGDDDTDDDDSDVIEEEVAAMCAIPTCDRISKTDQKLKPVSSRITISAQISVDCPSDISIINETARRLPAGTVNKVLVPRPMPCDTTNAMKQKDDFESREYVGQSDGECCMTEVLLPDENSDQQFLTSDASKQHSLVLSLRDCSEIQEVEETDSLIESETGSIRSSECGTHASSISDKQNTCVLKTNSAVSADCNQTVASKHHSQQKPNGNVKHRADEALDNISDEHDSGNGSSKYIDLHNLSDSSDGSEARNNSTLNENNIDFVDE